MAPGHISGVRECGVGSEEGITDRAARVPMICLPAVHPRAPLFPAGCPGPDCFRPHPLVPAPAPAALASGATGRRWEGRRRVRPAASPHCFLLVLLRFWFGWIL